MDFEGKRNLIVPFEERARRSWNELIQTPQGVPPAVVLEVTNYCNHADCAHCYINPTNEIESGVFIGEREVAVWADILKSNPRGCPEEVSIAGGEPTTHPKLGSILTLLKKRGFDTVLVTNGERLADAEYTERLTSSGDLDEVAISIRGAGILHDLLMLPANDPLWSSIPNYLSSGKQIDYAKKTVNKAPHFERTMQGLINLIGKNVRIGLNMDVQAATDMEEIVDDIIRRGGRVDIIYLQIQQETGRATERSAVLPNSWRCPTKNIIEEYLTQAERMKREGKVKEIIIIDPLPPDIVETLNLKEETIYRPRSVPAISPSGDLRADVLCTEITELEE